jgi:hypothetical protein
MLFAVVGGKTATSKFTHGIAKGALAIRSGEVGHSPMRPDKDFYRGGFRF